jgi:hypothetical protein
MAYYVRDLGLNIMWAVHALQACKPTEPVCEDPTPPCRPPSMLWPDPWECHPTIVCRPPSMWDCEPTFVCRPPTLPWECDHTVCDAPTPPCLPPSMREAPALRGLTTGCQGNTCLGSTRVTIRLDVIPSLAELQAELRAVVNEIHENLRRHKAGLDEERDRIDRALGDRDE